MSPVRARTTMKVGLFSTALAAAMLAEVSPAVADSPQPVPRSVARASSAAPVVVKRTVVDMFVVGFDAKVAGRAGYEVRRLPDGRRYLARKGSRYARTLSDAQALDWDGSRCGKSYLFLTDIGRRKYRISVGFRTKGRRRATTYNWRAGVLSDGYNKTHRWRGGLRFRKGWDGSQTHGVNGPQYYAGLTHRTSHYTTSLGLICRAGEPSDSRYIN